MLIRPASLPPRPIASAETPKACYATGVASLDDALGGGVAHGRLHEVYAAGADDAASAAGLVALLATGLATGPAGVPQSPDRSVVWLHDKRSVQGCGMLQGAGLAELGAIPQACLLVRAHSTKTLLQASLDAVRCPGLGVVILQAQGRMPELDLTASRRLSLAAQRSGVTMLVLRIDAEPVPSAAETRWAVGAAPSRALAANAPGAPVFAIELLRQRAGPAGLSWRLEWDRDRGLFRDAEISGAVVPVPVRGPAADSGTGPLPAARAA